MKQKGKDGSVRQICLNRSSEKCLRKGLHMFCTVSTLPYSSSHLCNLVTLKVPSMGHIDCAVPKAKFAKCCLQII